MADELSKDEQELLARHRAEKAKHSRKVTVKGTHKESGAEYSFDLDGDEAERVISRHRSLFEEEPDDEGAGKGTKGAAAKSAGSGSAHPYFKGKSAE
jgi:hypothetical protein